MLIGVIVYSVDNCNEKYNIYNNDVTYLRGGINSVIEYILWHYKVYYGDTVITEIKYLFKIKKTKK